MEKTTILFVLLTLERCICATMAQSVKQRKKQKKAIAV